MMPEPVTLLRGVVDPRVCADIALAAAAAPADAALALLPRLARGAVAGAVAARLGAAALCNVDQCFLRRQHAPARRPPGSRPHSWHQDGALGHDFGLAPQADGGLLPMLTCWIALVRCGAGHAPALQWTRRVPAGLLGPPQLTDEAVQAAYGAHGIDGTPLLEPGDALLFDGALLHRTHATPSMLHDRASFELRFFPGVPPRLAGQRFTACGFAP
jgi:hypothetical protein